MKTLGNPGRLDNVPAENGDDRFEGFASFGDPSLLSPGMLAYAENIRIDNRRALPRKGLSLEGYVGETAYAACRYYREEDDTEYIAIVTDTDVKLYGVVSGTVDYTIAYNDNNNAMPSWVTGPADIATWGQGTVSISSEVYIVQVFNKLIIFRGTTDSPLEWDGDTDNDFWTVEPLTLNFELDRPIYPDELALPYANFGISAYSRLIVPKGRDQAVFSDILSTWLFTVQNSFYVNQGSADDIVALVPYAEGQLIALKRNSIHLITNVHDLTNSETYEVTRQFGCVARDSAVVVGDLMFFLSDSGVQAITSGINAAGGDGVTPLRYTKVLDAPISQTIQPQIDRINWAYADKASAAYYDNRYWLAVPLDASAVNNALLVYNVLYGKWESLDTFDSSMQFDWLMTIMKDGKPRLVAVNSHGTIHLIDERTDGSDQIRDASSTSTYTYTGTALTRRYTLGTTNIKKFLNGLANYDFQTSGEVVTLDAVTQNPDLDRQVYTKTATGAEDVTANLRLGRLRGYGIQLRVEMSNGLPILRTTGVNGSIATNSPKEYS